MANTLDRPSRFGGFCALLGCEALLFTQRYKQGSSDFAIRTNHVACFAFTAQVMENDTVSINVRNKMISEATTIHWHGIHPFETPWTDGTVGVTQAGIRPGENFTYTFRAWPAGTHYWHSHMDGMQSAKGMRGPFIVKSPTDQVGVPHYDEEQIVVLADEWQNPDVCLKLEGAMAGNDVCADVEYASMNGQVAWGDLQVGTRVEWHALCNS